MYAKKSLGQHFLNSQSVLSAIRDAGDVNADDIVLEIGPGKGVLTEILLTSVAKVVAVEKDSALVMYLRERFNDAICDGRLDLIEQDILDFDPETLSSYGFSYKVVANIPYYITGAIIKKFLSARRQPERMVLLIQKDVAERILAKDGKESILSLSVKAYGEPYYEQTVRSGSFSPAPKVDSAIICIQDISRAHFTQVSEEQFFTLIKKGFSSKRKMLKNNIEADAGLLTGCGVDEKARAEDLTLKQWLCLASHTS